MNNQNILLGSDIPKNNPLMGVFSDAETPAGTWH